MSPNITVGQTLPLNQKHRNHSSSPPPIYLTNPLPGITRWPLTSTDGKLLLRTNLHVEEAETVRILPIVLIPNTKGNLLQSPHTDRPTPARSCPRPQGQSPHSKPKPITVTQVPLITISIQQSLYKMDPKKYRKIRWKKPKDLKKPLFRPPQNPTPHNNPDAPQRPSS